MKNALFIILAIITVICAAALLHRMYAKGYFFTASEKEQQEIDKDTITELEAIAIAKLNELKKQLTELRQMQIKESEMTQDIKENVQHFDYDKLIAKWTIARQTLINENPTVDPKIITPDEIRAKIIVLNNAAIKSNGQPANIDQEITYTIENNFSNTVDGRPIFKFNDEKSVGDLTIRWNVAVNELTKLQKEITYDSVFEIMATKQYVEVQAKNYIIAQGWIGKNSASDSMIFQMLPNAIKPTIVNTEFADKQKISDYMPTWKQGKIDILGESFDQIINSASIERIETIRNQVIIYLSTKGLITKEMIDLINKYEII